jgi:hypothetical protein
VQLDWTERAYVFGTGAVAVKGRFTVELIPFVGSDGSGRVKAFSVFLDGPAVRRPFVGRVPVAGDQAAAELADVQAGAELLLCESYPEAFPSESPQ